MKKHSTIKRFVLVLLLIVTPLLSAFTFEEDHFSLEIPENSNTYYYTQRGTNMTGEMLENAKKQDVICLIGVYRDNVLLYTFKAQQRLGTATQVCQALADETQTTYTLSQPQPTSLAGAEGFLMTGTSVQNSGFGMSVYVMKDSPSIVFTTLYSLQTDASQQAQQLFASLRWPAQTAPVTSSPDQLSNTDQTDTQTPTTKTNIWDMVVQFGQTAYQSILQGPVWLLPACAGGAITGIFLIALLCRRKKRRYRPRYVARNKR